MVCPFCKNDNLRVIDKRENSQGSIRRRRECENCKKRFTTYERIEKISLTVEKRDGRIEEFDREKIKRGIFRAVKKRKIPNEEIEALIDQIEQKAFEKQNLRIKTKEIGDLVLKGLTKLDKLGALLFASVYKEFDCLEEVQKELERLESKKV